MAAELFRTLLDESAAAAAVAPETLRTSRVAAEAEDFEAGVWFELPAAARGLALMDAAGNVMCWRDVAISGDRRRVTVAPRPRAQVDGARCLPRGAWSSVDALWTAEASFAAGAAGPPPGES